MRLKKANFIQGIIDTNEVFVKVILCQEPGALEAPKGCISELACYSTTNAQPNLVIFHNLF